MDRNIAIIYTSYGGNTRDLAEIIKLKLEECGLNAHTYSNKDVIDYENYDYFLFGSLTWVDGKLPIQMRKLMKDILIENPRNIKRASLFGTGETQWGMENYCKAVDEMAYHLSKNNIIVDFKLKIEQNPLGKEKQIEIFAKNILEVF